MEDIIKLNIEEILQSKNVAELLSEEERTSIMANCLNLYEEDRGSMQEWLDHAENIIKLAKMEDNNKSWPWQGASNIKHPLAMTAAMQFHSRTSASLVKGGRLVFSKIRGLDPDGAKYKTGDRVAKYMSWQLLDSPKSEWENHNDKALMILALIGTVFKKAYYDPISNTIVSKYVDWRNVFVNNSEAGISLEDIRRITHKYTISHQEIKQNQLFGTFSTFEEGTEYDYKASDTSGEQECEVIEQHTWLDLDGDGLAEPYIVIIDITNNRLLRIIQRFSSSDIKTNSDGTIYKIEALENFTDFHFIPSPDGKFFSYGYGTLLFSGNKSVNKMLNTLVNAGELYSLNAGFMKDGILKNQSLKNSNFTPGEYKPVRVTVGDSVQDNFYPLPFKEPSQVLLALTQYMVQASEKLTSVTDVVTGTAATENAKTGAIKELINQSQTVFTAIQKRVYRSYKREFQKLYNLNSFYVPLQLREQYLEVLDDPEARPEMDFYINSFDVVPVIDPTEAAELKRQVKKEELIQLMQLPNVNVPALVMEFLKLTDLTNPEQYMAQPQGPTPEQQAQQAELQLKQEELRIKDLSARGEFIRDVSEADKNNADGTLDAYVALSKDKDDGGE